MRKLAAWAIGKVFEFAFDDVDLDLEGLDAELADDLHPLPDFETRILWVLDADALKAVFAIARAEENDDLALLTVQANTAWTISEDDVEEWPPEH